LVLLRDFDLHPLNNAKQAGAFSYVPASAQDLE